MRQTKSGPVIVQGKTYTCLSAAIRDLQSIITDRALKRKTIGDQVKMIYERIFKQRWTLEQAFGFHPPPPWAAKGCAHPIRCAGKLYDSERALADAFGVPRKVLYQRLHRDHWTAEAAVGLESSANNRNQLRDRFGSIYSITNRFNDKIYIGVSMHARRRLERHIAQAKSGKFTPGSLQEDIARFGIENFIFKILAENVPAHELASRERYLIEQFCTLAPNGYNLNAGGVLGGLGAPIWVGNIRCFGYAHVAATFGISLGKLMRRIDSGWTIDEAAGIVSRRPKFPIELTIDAGGGPRTYPSAKAACAALGLCWKSVGKYRYRKRVSWEAAIYYKLARKISADFNDPSLNPEGAFDTGRRSWPRRYSIIIDQGLRMHSKRIAMTLDVGGGPIHYPSAAAACRHLGLRRGEIARYRYRNGLSWEDSIRRKFATNINAQLANAELGLQTGHRSWPRSGKHSVNTAAAMSGAGSCD